MNSLARALLLFALSWASMTWAAELTSVDAGVYSVVGRDGQPTALQYRFLHEAGSWRAEGREGGGPWKSISCESGCRYEVTDKGQALLYLPSSMRQTHEIACIQNVAQAFCKYVEKGNPSLGGYIVMARVTNPPTPIPLLRQK